MNILNTIAGWARSAWNAITGLPGDIGAAIANLWHYVTNVHNLVSWLTGVPQLRAVERFLYNISVFHAAQLAINDALRRLAGWLWLTMVRPVRDALNAEIARLRAWTTLQLVLLRALVLLLYRASLAYTRRLVGVERSQRIAAINAEHAAMLRAVAACLATVQKQAASGYNSGLHDRLTLVGTLLHDLADRNPLVKDLVSLLVNAVIDLETIDNPLARYVIGKLLAQIIAHSGIDQATGSLITRLLGPLAGQPKAAGLFDVAKDVSDRLGALEAQWAEFMKDGGPEVEQAGREWKDLTGVVADAGILALFGLAVADPAAWATGVADTIGTAGNAALDAIVSVINRA